MIDKDVRLAIAQEALDRANMDASLAKLLADHEQRLERLKDMALALERVLDASSNHLTIQLEIATRRIAVLEAR